MNYSEITELVKQTKPIFFDRVMSDLITVKGKADYVTKVDFTVQEFLKSKLTEKYPDIEFMAEEQKNNSDAVFRTAWILDPVDGTNNLIHGYRHSCVSLGLCHEGNMVFGVVYDPYKEEVFTAVRGQGAFLNGEPIHVSKETTLEDSLINIGTTPYNKKIANENFSFFQSIFENCLDVRRSGSAALDLAYVACGRIDGYVERELKPWDFAAGVLLVEEAGGKVTTYKAEKPKFNQILDIFSSNGKIHGKFIAKFAEYMN